MYTAEWCRTQCLFLLFFSELHYSDMLYSLQFQKFQEKNITLFLLCMQRYNIIKYC